MLGTIYRNRMSETKINQDYSFKETEDGRWGIYLNERLLATVGSYEACRSIGTSLGHNLSHTDALKATMAYKKAIDHSLIIN